jgi:hypothetical protein
VAPPTATTEQAPTQTTGRTETEQPLTPPSQPTTSVKGGGATQPPPSEQPPTQTTAQGEETLPFTGFQIAGVVALGAALLGAGLVLRRIGRARGNQ